MGSKRFMEGKGSFGGELGPTVGGASTGTGLAASLGSCPSDHRRRSKTARHKGSFGRNCKGGYGAQGSFSGDFAEVKLMSELASPSKVRFEYSSSKVKRFAL
jgi:hypothetical protein